jgi:hypothetical protein
VADTTAKTGSRTRRLKSCIAKDEFAEVSREEGGLKGCFFGFFKSARDVKECRLGVVYISIRR